jgi:nicotinamide phosphoribosyltransferase
MKKNIVTMTDSYKMGHWQQYPDGTEYVYSYFEARNGAKFDETVFFGLQYLMLEYLEGVVVTKEKIDFAEKLAQKHFGNDYIFNRDRWDYIVEKHGGKLPVRIKAVPEGMPVPVNNVMMSVENTDPNCYWLTNHLETMLTRVWHSSTVASLSRTTKKMIVQFLKETADSLDGLPFKLHDFGSRGVSSAESAGIGGAGHLVNFLGTDTVEAMEFAMYYYDADLDSLAFSVPATEHSVMTSLGEDGEADMYKRVLDKYPTGILSVVSDSYDIYRATAKYVGEYFKDDILQRDGIFVVRPDSGDPVETVMRLLYILGDKFGDTKNSKGYRVLNPKVRLIWGDGIDFEGIKSILTAMKAEFWSADNIVFGMGGGLLQKINRDTQRFAFKCSAQCRNGEWYDIQKKPLDESKKSKAGKLAFVPLRLVVYDDKGNFTKQYTTVENCMKDDPYDILETVFLNGEIVKKYTFDEVRENASL